MLHDFLTATTDFVTGLSTVIFGDGGTGNGSTVIGGGAIMGSVAELITGS